MLNCYMDDSGTHCRSDIIVWGGVAADIRLCEAFEERWRDALKNPCETRNEIDMFHSAHLHMGVENFDRWSFAERDRTRYNFRRAITEVGLTWISYGISVTAWNRVVPHEIKRHFGAETLVFAKLIEHFCKGVASKKEPIAFHFDQGRRNAEMESIIQPAIKIAGHNSRLITYTFSPAASYCGLQAADMVAHETYKFLVELLGNSSAAPDAHLSKLVAGAHDYRYSYFGEEEISIGLANSWHEIEKILESSN